MFHHHPKLLIGMVQALDIMGQPADITLRGNNFESGKTGQHSTKNEAGQRLLNFVNEVHEPHGRLVDPAA